MRFVKIFGAVIPVPEEGENIPSHLPSAIWQTIERIGGRGLVRVTTKILTESDVIPHHSRLLISNREELWGELSEEEKRRVSAKEYVEVEVVDPRGVRHEMKLKKWESVDKFVLNSGWTKLVQDNRLEAGVDCVELWSFRMMGSKLCFALHVERRNHP